MAVIMAVVMAVVFLAILGLDHSKKPIPAPRRSIGEPLTKQTISLRRTRRANIIAADRPRVPRRFLCAAGKMS
jgi:hypothetical protein